MSLVKTSSQAMYNGAETTPFLGIGIVLIINEDVKMIFLKNLRVKNSHITTMLASFECCINSSLSRICRSVLYLSATSSALVITSAVKKYQQKVKTQIFSDTVSSPGAFAEGFDDFLKKRVCGRVRLVTHVVDHCQTGVVDSELGKQARHAI